MARCLLLALAPTSIAVAPISVASPSLDLCKFPAAAARPDALSFTFGCLRRCSSWGRRRLVVRAGPPSANSLILAFVLPLSLLVGTIFTAARVADRLDEKYLEELAMNEAIMEEKMADEEQEGDGDYEDDDENGSILPEEKEELAVAPQRRNRPKREA